MGEISERDLKTLETWLRRFKGSQDYCQPFFDKGRRNYKNYKSYKEKRDKIYRHDIFVPYTFAYVEDMAAYLMLSVLSAPITFSLNPRVKAISRELCAELEQVLHWAMTEESAEFVLELDDLVKYALIFNTAYLINYPLIRPEKDGNHFDKLVLDAPHPFDVFPEPNIKRASRMNWIIKRSFEDKDTLKSLEAKGQYENVEAGLGPLGEDPTIVKMLEEIGFSGKGPDSKKGQEEILDCMTDGHVITILNRKAVIRDTTKDGVRPYIFKFPILDCRFGGGPGEYFPTGMAESMAPLQEESNVLRSQRRDNVSLLLNKLFIYDIMAGEVDLNTLYSAPGNVIITSNQDAIKELPISDVTSSSYKESQELQLDMQSVTSMWDYNRGATPRRRETASGLIRLQQAAQSRMEFCLRKLDAYILTPLARRMIVYLREGISEHDYTSIVGLREEQGQVDPQTGAPIQAPGKNCYDEFKSLDLGDVARLFNVMPLTESIQSVKEVDTNSFIQAFDRVINLPCVNQEALVRALMNKVGQKDLPDIITRMSPEARDVVKANAPGVGASPNKAAVPGPPTAPGPGSSARPLPGDLAPQATAGLPPQAVIR